MITIGGMRDQVEWGHENISRVKYSVFIKIQSVADAHEYIIIVQSVADAHEYIYRYIYIYVYVYVYIYIYMFLLIVSTL